MQETFKKINFRSKTLVKIDQAVSIIKEYQKMGFKLTLRQLFYQHVARNLLENTRNRYDWLSNLVRDARDTGKIDWDAMEDRSRTVNFHAAWDSPADFIKSTVECYAEDWWLDQKYRPEVWIEKDALLGVITPVCNEFRVPSFAHKGNTGQLHMYEAGKRFAGYLKQGLTPIVLHLADHDPSGIDMTPDVENRLALYARKPIEVKRLALKIEQVRGLPPNFAKEKDKNLKKYVAKFGTNQCWELDALAPNVIANLIRSAIKPLIGSKKWAAAQRKEQRNHKVLEQTAVTLAK
jgi:hypothetical protein